MSETLRSKSFWLGFLIIFGLVFLIGINSNRMYVGETKILVLAKSEKAVRNIDQIIGNVREIPQSLSFYDKLLEKNDDIDDLNEGLPDHKRKAAWNEILQIKSIKGSGVLAVRISSTGQLQAEIVSKKVAQDMAIVASRYYDIQNDVDIRIIDGPIVSPQNSVFNLQIILFSLIAGLLGGAVAYFIFSHEVENFQSLPRLTFPPFTADKSEKKIPAEAEEEDILASITKKSAPVATAARQAAAPENLPVGSEFVLSSLRRVEKAQKEAEKISQEPKTHEATDEEIRRRLNKLLGGKI